MALALAGCATYSPSVPENYSGPQAQLEDSAKTYSGSKADFFVVDEINGAKVDNSLNATVRSNQGRGMATVNGVRHDYLGIFALTSVARQTPHELSTRPCIDPTRGDGLAGLVIHPTTMDV